MTSSEIFPALVHLPFITQWFRNPVDHVVALKTITAELPSEGKVASSACSKLSPRLLSQIQKVRCFLPATYLLISPFCSMVHTQPATPPETLIEALSILSILISRFPAHVDSATATHPPLKVLAPLLSHQ